MLDKIGFAGSLAGLFYKGTDWNDPDHLRACEYAFKNLAMHSVESIWPEMLPFIQFDDLKLKMMLRRFYRDAFGVWHFNTKLEKLCPDKTTRSAILAEINRLSIRINSPKPRKTRIAAAFSLWMSTFRPIYINGTPPVPPSGIWQLDAAVNFKITTDFLMQYGTIQVGTLGKDRNLRLQRIYYDFTCRDLNLSSLELLYCSIFRRNVTLESED
jgi:hypothetical protein